MTVDELRTPPEETELIVQPPVDNVYQFPGGKHRDRDEEVVLKDLEKALENWF